MMVTMMLMMVSTWPAHTPFCSSPFEKTRPAYLLREVTRSGFSVSVLTTSTASKWVKRIKRTVPSPHKTWVMFQIKKTNCPWISAPGDDIASKQEWLHVTCVWYIRVLSTGEMMMMMIATFKKINVMTLMMMMMTAPMRCNPCMLHLHEHGVLPNVCYTCMGYMAWLHLPV